MIRLHLADLARRIGLERRSGDAEFEGVSTDSRTLAPGQLFVALQGSRFDGHDFLPKVAIRGAAGAVVSRWQDVSLPQILCPDTEAALGQIAAMWRLKCETRMFGVTGSNGKTTVKSMLHAILQRQAPCLVNEGNLNNEIGLPLTLCRLGDEHRYTVAEMGAGKPGDIRYLANIARPQVGVITNAGPAHLEGMGSVEGVSRVKGELIDSLPDDGIAVLNADDAHFDYWRSVAGDRPVVRFALEAEAEVTGDFDEGSRTLTLRTPAGEQVVQLPVSGRHNAMNALAAAAAASTEDISLAEIAAGLESFKPVGGRMEVRELDSWTLIEDTYNANPASLTAGIQDLVSRPGTHWLVLGDMAELGDDSAALHFQAGVEARGLGVVCLLCVGELSKHAAAGFGAGAEHFDSREALVEQFAETLLPGVVCLVKGSRSMRMEEVATELARCAAGGEPCC